MATLAGKMKKPEPDKKKKIIIIAAVIAVVCLAAAGGLYLKFKGGNEDEFGGRPPRMHDANLPDMHKQSYDDIAAFKNSDKYKKLSQREQMMYSMMTRRQEEEHNMETYFTLSKEKQAAFLDQMIDDMQAQRENMEKMMKDNPPPQRPNDANDPNAQKRMAERQAQRNNPSNMRSGSERGTALQRAQREQYREAMRQRMQERGISMPTGRGGGGGPGGGGPGGP